MPEIVLRKEAVKRGLTRYFTGKPCPKGHVAERYTTKSNCVVCTRLVADAHDKKNPEGKHTRTVASQKRNPERTRQVRKEFRGRHKEQLSAKYKGWYNDNKEHMSVLNKAWRKNNPEALRSKDSTRRARERNSYRISLRYRTEIEVVYAEAARLTRETGERHEVDHIVPFKHDVVSGLHVPWNLRVVTAYENRVKKNKLVDESFRLAFVEV